MLPYKSIIEIQKNSETPVYVQIANSVAREIRNGILKPGTKLPGARSLASLVEVHRNTVVSAYDELHLQGYIELQPKKGAFISKRIPEIKPKTISTTKRGIFYPEYAGYEFEISPVINLDYEKRRSDLEFNDGLPDERIAPLEELTRAYRSLFKRKSRLQFGYSDPEGNRKLREELSKYVNETRGLQTTFVNILITKGSQMGIYLISQLLITQGDVVIVGETNYHAADIAFAYAGARIERVPVDMMGLDTDAIESMCKKHKIRVVYVTPHHHYPTTITMTACRRMKLLELAERFGFAIVEDDYDYDFHYKSSPILPLASADNKGMVINIGSLSKNFSPALRVAYLIAPKNVVHGLSKLRMIIDRQGDYLLEQAVAELFDDGTFRRHLKKAVATYKERRDLLCQLLKKEMEEKVSFKIPDGGLAVWTRFEKSISLDTVASKALKAGLNFEKHLIYPTSEGDFARIGFASLNKIEIAQAIQILKSAIG